MIDKRDALKGPAMRSSGAATGTRSRMPARSISTTTGPTTTTTTSASAYPRTQHPGAAPYALSAGEGTLLGRASRGADQAPNARQHAHPGTAAGATVAAAEHGADVIEREPNAIEHDEPQQPFLFQVWIDLKCGRGTPDWWWNSPPQSLQEALCEAAEARSKEWICQVLPEGMNPRPDGRWDNP